MLSLHIVEFSLVGEHSLDLVDIIQLSRTSKILWQVVRSLREVHCTRAVNDHSLNIILDFFPEIRLLSINSNRFDWSMVHKVFLHPQIMQLRLNSLCLLSSPSDDSTLREGNYNADLKQPDLTDIRWSRIRGLEFHNCHSTGEAIEYVIHNCRNISRLTFHGSIFVTNSNIEKMISKLEFLEILELTSLLGIQQVNLNLNLQRSLISLKITKCSFLNNLYFDPEGSFQSLVSCDLSCTAVDSDCLDLVVSCSPLLRILIVQECSSIYGHIHFKSRSLTSINLQHTCNMTELEIDCPKLNHLEIHGCLNLSELTLKSFSLRQLDLAMLTQLSRLVIDCICIADIEFSGCKKLKCAKVSARSPFSESFSRKYYRNEYLEESQLSSDSNFIHFGCCSLKQTNASESSDKNSLREGHAKLRSSQLYRRSSSI